MTAVDIIKVAAFALAAVFAILTVKKNSPAFAVLIGVCAAAVILIMITPALREVIAAFNESAAKLSIGSVNVAVLLKIVGIAYIAEFASQICVDAGESAIASKVELAGKILIMSISAPIVLGLLDEIMRYI